MQTRQYMMDMMGGHGMCLITVYKFKSIVYPNEIHLFFSSHFSGNVMSHHKTIKDLEQYYSKVGDNKDVKNFLKNITSDKEG